MTTIRINRDSSGQHLNWQITPNSSKTISLLLTYNNQIKSDKPGVTLKEKRTPNILFIQVIRTEIGLVKQRNEQKKSIMETNVLEMKNKYACYSVDL